MNEVVLALSEITTIYLLVKSTTDKEEVSSILCWSRIRSIFSLRSFRSSQKEHQTKQILSFLVGIDIPTHHVLHHTNNIGKIAFLRQLKPYLHIEFDDEVYQSTKMHIPLLVFHHCQQSQQQVSNDQKPKSYLHQIKNYNELALVELRV